MGKLTINDQEIEGVDVKTVVHRYNGDVEIRTVGKELIVVAGARKQPLTGIADIAQELSNG